MPTEKRPTPARTALSQPVFAGFQSAFDSVPAPPQAGPSSAKRPRLGQSSACAAPGRISTLQRGFQAAEPTTTSPDAAAAPPRLSRLSALNPLALRPDALLHTLTHSLPSSHVPAPAAAAAGLKHGQAVQPVSALALPSARFSSPVKSATASDESSPSKRRRKDRKPRYNFHELASEQLKRNETAMTLWAHQLSRESSGSSISTSAGTLVAALNDAARVIVTAVLDQTPNTSSLQLFKVKSATATDEGEGLVCLRSSSRAALARLELEDGVKATVQPDLQGVQLAIGDEVWLFDWTEITLETEQLALLSSKFAVVQQS